MIYHMADFISTTWEQIEEPPWPSSPLSASIIINTGVCFLFSSQVYLYGPFYHTYGLKGAPMPQQKGPWSNPVGK